MPARCDSRPPHPYEPLSGGYARAPPRGRTQRVKYTRATACAGRFLLAFNTKWPGFLLRALRWRGYQPLQAFEAVDDLNLRAEREAVAVIVEMPANAQSLQPLQVGADPHNDLSAYNRKQRL
jgi:hypothetical protein